MWQDLKRRPLWKSPSSSVLGSRQLNTGVATVTLPLKSLNQGMNAHIRSVHTKKALLCSFCAFSYIQF